MSMTLAELRELRIRLNISLKEAGKYLGYSGAYIANIENGTCKIPEDFEVKYENFLTKVINGEISCNKNIASAVVWYKELLKNKKQIKELKTLREELGISQSEIAEAIGLDNFSYDIRETLKVPMSKTEYKNAMKYLKKVKIKKFFRKLFGME